MSNLDFEYFKQMKEQRHRTGAERFIFQSLVRWRRTKPLLPSVT